MFSLIVGCRLKRLHWLGSAAAGLAENCAVPASTSWKEDQRARWTHVLFDAVDIGDVDTMCTVLKSGVSVDSTDQQGRTLLHRAVRVAHTSCVPTPVLRVHSQVSSQVPERTRVRKRKGVPPFGSGILQSVCLRIGFSVFAACCG